MMDRVETIQRNYYYHSQLLVPEKKAIEARDEPTEEGRDEVLMLWQLAHQPSYHFKEKEKCYHVDDLWQMLRVDRIVRVKYQK